LRVVKSTCNVSIMGTKRGTGPGPSAGRVRANLRALREERRISLRDLSKRLEQLGHPLLPSGLSKIETGDRRADVDDLIAIALALDVSPNRLLLPKTAGENETIELTQEIETSERAAWRWASGEVPLEAKSDISTSAEQFRDENRPHDPDDQTLLRDIEPHVDVLTPAVRACREAIEQSGLPQETVLNYVRTALRFLGAFSQATTESAKKQAAGLLREAGVPERPERRS